MDKNSGNNVVQRFDYLFENKILFIHIDIKVFNMLVKKYFMNHPRAQM